MKRRMAIMIATIILPVSLMAGCGASSDSYTSADTNSSVAAMEDAAATQGIGSSYSYDYDNYESENEAPAAGEDASLSENAQPDISQKLVYTGSLSIETLDYAATISNLRSRIKECGGFVESEYEWDSNTGWYMNDTESAGTMHMDMTVRVPSQKYEEFINAIEGEEKITSKNSQVENITKSYYETAALLESSRIQEERLLDMMENAYSIEDMIAIETRLTEVQKEINVYKSQLAVMDTNVSYSTVTLSVEEVRRYTEVKNTFKFTDRLSNTVRESWESFWNILEWLLFFVIRLIPIILIFTPIVLLIIFIIRRTQPPEIRQMKKQAKQERKRRQRMGMPPQMPMPPAPQMPQMHQPINGAVQETLAVKTQDSADKADSADSEAEDKK